MTISFLLPTRNRLEYLKLAIETVRRQDSTDWEIAVSDNDSSEDIGGYLASLADERIRYARTPRSVPVTDNWNNALALSTGDYVLMLGDDDGLLPGYITHMTSLIERFDQPDMLYTGSLLFSYPGVDPNYPDGFLIASTYADFLDGAREPFVLPRERAIEAVRTSMRFKLAFNFNMQLSLLSRALIDRLASRGGVFQSAFPDYYASCAALLAAQRVVIDPLPRVVVGVTPKSYGFFHLNERETEGRALLAAGDAVPPQLPGTNINEGWLAAMQAVETQFGEELGLRVARGRFRRLQAAHVYSRALRGSGSPGEVEQFEAGLPALQRMIARTANRTARLVIRLLPARAWSAIAGRAFEQFPIVERERTEGRYRDVLEVFEGSERPA